MYAIGRYLANLKQGDLGRFIRSHDHAGVCQIDGMLFCDCGTWLH